MVLAGDRPARRSFGLYPAVVILLREILVSGLREYLAGLRVGLPVTRLAKWKTGFQMGALGTLLAGDTGAAAIGMSWLPVSLIGQAMLWVAAFLTLLTGWDYLMAGLHHAARSPPRHARPRPPAERRRAGSRAEATRRTRDPGGGMAIPCGRARGGRIVCGRIC